MFNQQKQLIYIRKQQNDSNCYIIEGLKWMRKLDRRVRRTKRLLENAFLELMSSKQYAEISVTDIVTLADYNRTTFYRHYENKNMFVKEVINGQVNNLVEAFKTPYKKHDYIHLGSISPVEITVFKHIIENKSFYSLWNKFEKISEFTESFLNALTKFYKNEIVLLTNPKKELDNNLYTSFYAYGILGLIIEWIKNDLKQTPEFMAEQMCKILNHYPGESYLREL